MRGECTDGPLAGQVIPNLPDAIEALQLQPLVEVDGHTYRYETFVEITVDDEPEVNAYFAYVPKP